MAIRVFMNEDGFYSAKACISAMYAVVFLWQALVPILLFWLTCGIGCLELAAGLFCCTAIACVWTIVFCYKQKTPSLQLLQRGWCQFENLAQA